LDADDLLDRLLAPGAVLDRVIVGHDAHRPPSHRAHAGHDAVGRGVGLLVAREEEVLLELRAGIEQQLQPVPDEELAFLLQLLAILDVPLLDAGALLEVPLLAHALGPRHRGLLKPASCTASRSRTVTSVVAGVIGIGPEDDDRHAVAVVLPAEDGGAALCGGYGW